VIIAQYNFAFRISIKNKVIAVLKLTDEVKQTLNLLLLKFCPYL